VISIVLSFNIVNYSIVLRGGSNWNRGFFNVVGSSFYRAVYVCSCGIAMSQMSVCLSNA